MDDLGVPSFLETPKSADQMASTTLTTIPTLPTIVLHSWIFRLALFHPAAGEIYYQTSSNNKTKPSGSVARPCEHNTLQDLTHRLCFFNMSSCSRQTFTCNRSLERHATVSNVNPKKSKCWRKVHSNGAGISSVWSYFWYNLFTVNNPYIYSILIIRYNMYTSYMHE